MKAKLFGQIHDLVSNSLIITAAETKVRYNEVEILPAADYDTQQAAIAGAKTIIEQARATLKKAMLSGDIPTTPNTYTLVNADLDLRDALALIQKAKG